MDGELLLGIRTNGIEHRHADPMPDVDTRFRMVRDAGVFDHADETTEPHEVEAFGRASELIPDLAHGEGCHPSLVEQGIACVEWLRAAWGKARAAART